jgi:hypothetical protein
MGIIIITEQIGAKKNFRRKEKLRVGPARLNFHIAAMLFLENISNSNF